MPLAAVAAPALYPLTGPRLPLSPLFFSSPGRRHRLKPPLLLASPVFPPGLYVRTDAFAPAVSSRRRVGAVSSGEGFEGSLQGGGLGGPSLDAVLAVAEILCIAPPAICSIVCLAVSVLPSSPKHLQLLMGSRVFVLQFSLLVGAVVVGAVIRQRQWQRVSRHDGTGVNLIARIEKVEEDLRSSATIVRVLSRQLEKLGIRFRVTRKVLKEPISETATLAKKNSEATRALAMQEDILEKELGEIQKVLLAMQEQQQKQLELILAIGKAGRLIESKRNVIEDQGSSGNSNPISKKKVVNQVEIQTEQFEVSNDKA